VGVRIVGDLGKLERKLSAMARGVNRRVGPQIGEALVSSTIQRFNEQRSPDGQPWAPLAANTVAPRKADYTKRGRLRKPAEQRIKNRKILIQSARLRNSISSRASGTQVAVGTNVVYAPTHQFGAKQGDYGQTSRGAPIPWGDVPARPFLGISDSDQAEIERILMSDLEDG
jgi:phage virion morphogenesis protein